MAKIKIIGSSHIAKKSFEGVKRAVEEFSPDIIALELDPKRAYSLLQKKGKPNYFLMLKRVGIKGFLFALIGGFAQKKLGKIVGVEPGAEMKASLLIAKKTNTRVMLIDQDIEVTLKKLSKQA